ncbi:universal stress protein UspA-like protein [Mycolicibacterium chubuense NBB4]|uniref:Universal stress protein UspA-like protein n=1 Tax=Mycolicibacterium chubuense (strain NBB4) TaxID=710421 RepID=I4BG86_MYCCN|nr:universal stress protein [Mycolicibacterium chubuense]AFM16293.1 universal stress protein UspA-like protein [Mycolicibacterium chubuense NBB4]
MTPSVERERWPVVVGVDGSRAALNAVRWATVEAADRGVVLRLVHVVASDRANDTRADILTEAADAATRTAEDVEVQTAIVSGTVSGTPADVLVEESHRAAMVCIGADSRRSAESGLYGPTAGALACRAGSPVAVIRSRADGTPQTDGVISVVLSDEPGNDDVVHLAMHEGRLRHATVRQIDHRADSWIRRYPDVHVEIVAAGAPCRYPRDRAPADRSVGLAVVGPRDAQELTSMAVPNCHPIHGYPDCSVLLVRR